MTTFLWSFYEGSLLMQVVARAGYIDIIKQPDDSFALSIKTTVIVSLMRE